ncbi:MAG: S8 family serine peptidase [Oculatellaceae cyanobacterium Prado106]|jgi:subtilisin family serine protease|nr:S8 family serine peptidase [Oculatellaceae cyanobacterium Prado106]
MSIFKNHFSQSFSAPIAPQIPSERTVRSATLNSLQDWQTHLPRSFARAFSANTSVNSSANSSERTIAPGNSLKLAGHKASTKTLRPNQSLQGTLSRKDKRHPAWGGLKDEYPLTGLQPNQQVQITVRSQAFDTYLQVINLRNGQVIGENDDLSSGTTHSRLNFTVRRGVQYGVRVTSYDPDETGSYRVQVTTKAAPPPGKRGYNFDYGYGLVDAAAAVARSVGQNSFPSQPSPDGSWTLDMLKAPAAWAQGFTGQGVIVAVIDTGVNYNHPDLAANMWRNIGEIPDNGLDDDGNGFIDDSRGWSFVDADTNDPMDFDLSDNNGHGTHVAGTIAALNNGFGTTGVAPGATIMPIRVIGGSDDLFLDKFDANLASGIYYAVNNGAKVLNISLGNDPGEAPLTQTRTALEYARQRGAIAIMAAGNEREDGANRPIEPASYASQNLGMAVGAVNRRRKVAEFSNPAGNNRSLDFVVAPGVGIRSTILGDQYDLLDGTSMAAPQVAGVAALMLSANPSLTPTQLEEILIATATTAGLS